MTALVGLLLSVLAGEILRFDTGASLESPLEGMASS